MDPVADFADRVFARLEDRTRDLRAALAVASGVLLVPSMTYSASIDPDKEHYEDRARRRSHALLDDADTSGEQAAVFAAHALTTVFAGPYIEPNPRSAFAMASEALASQFPLQKEQAALIAEATRHIDSSTSYGLEAVEGVLTYHAMCILSGERFARALPPFVKLPQDWRKWFGLHNWEWRFFIDQSLPFFWNEHSGRLLRWLRGEEPEEVEDLAFLVAT